MNHPQIAAPIAGAMLLVAASALAHQPAFTTEFDRDRCTFSTVGNNPFFPLVPGHAVRLESEDEEVLVTVLAETQVIDGVRTRVLEEREWEDGELVEVSRNFLAHCQETGDVWYFGEDVEDYEDGVLVGSEGAWRAGQDGARAGILMPGSPLVGARFFQEIAPEVALDRGEVVRLGGSRSVPAGTFAGVLEVLDTDALDPGPGDLKVYAPGVGLIVDEDLELVEIIHAPCDPTSAALCLGDGRFRVTIRWRDGGNPRPGRAVLPSDLGGAFWFDDPEQVELLVSLRDGCGAGGNGAVGIFASGATEHPVTVIVLDTATDVRKSYHLGPGQPFALVADPAAFACL